MVLAFEAIDDNGGSIRVGTTGTIGSLMTRELQSMKHMPQASIPSRRKNPTIPVSVPCGAILKKTQPRRNSPNEASSSSSSSSNNNSNQRLPLNAPKTRSNLRKNDHCVPMLSSENVTTDGNTSREKPNKKGSYLVVEVVDLKCGSPDKAWPSPITASLKKLSFSKLSETVA